MKNDKYKLMSVEELKEVQLDILNYVANYCINHQIHYWLDSGTLLGAIRHNGYIPWDDDIDIGMLRTDYDSFINSFNVNNNSRFEVHCIENDSQFFLPHAKVYDKTTILFEPNESGYKLCVNIDVFVYDNAPDDDIIVNKMYDRRDLLRKRHSISNYKGDFSGNVLIKFLKIVRKNMYKIVFRKCIEKMVDNSKCYANSKTNRVGNFTSFTRMTCDKKVFDSFIDVEFEGRMYKAPIGYDEWLKSFYGDYMKLPPPEKRISHHSFLAYKI